MTQSSLSTGTWLLGFRWVGDGEMSHLRTEDDRVCSSPGTAAYCKQSGYPLKAGHCYTTMVSGL